MKWIYFLVPLAVVLLFAEIDWLVNVLDLLEIECNSSSIRRTRAPERIKHRLAH